MKKFICILLCVALCVGFLSCCGNADKKDADKLNIVTTVFPLFDWTRSVTGDNADITMLLDNGFDLQGYQPTDEDIDKISDCDVFIYVGGESDEWVDDALKESKNKEMTVINLFDVLGDSLKKEENKNIMQADANKGEGEKAEYDEHIWLSLKNAQVLCKHITDKICEKDSKNADKYRDNFNKYNENLISLDQRYEQAVQSSVMKTLVFSGRFLFRYLADDYGIVCYAAFSGRSAETEASFATVTYLAKRIDALGLKSIIVVEGSDHQIAQTILSNTKTKNQKILMLDSMQSTTYKNAENGTTYISIMERNLSTLRIALS